MNKQKDCLKLDECLMNLEQQSRLKDVCLHVLEIFLSLLKRPSKLDDCLGALALAYVEPSAEF